jgi:hypothetical protein
MAGRRGERITALQGNAVEMKPLILDARGNDEKTLSYEGVVDTLVQRNYIAPLLKQVRNANALAMRCHRGCPT